MLILIVCYSCNDNRNVNHGSKLEVIKLDPDLAEYIYIDSLYINEEIIPLTTSDTSLVDRVSKFQVTDKRYYVLTGNKKVLAFSKNGNVEYIIDKHGKGPAEYVYPMCFYVDPDDKFLEIYNRGSKNVVVFDNNGDYITDWKYDLYITKATHYKGSICMLVGSEINYIDGKESNMQLFVYDSLHNLHKSYIPFNKKIWKFLGVGDRIDMVHVNDNLHIRVLYNDTVYCFSKGNGGFELEPKYLLDYGKYSIPEHLFHKGFADCSEFDRAMDKYDCIQNLYGYTETDEYINFAFEMNRTLYQFFYSKKSKKAKIIDKIIITYNGFLYERKLRYNDIPKTVHNNHLYFIVEPGDYIKELEKIKKHLGEQKWKEFQRNNKKYCDFVGDLNYMDNPIVVKRKINPDLFN